MPLSRVHHAACGRPPQGNAGSGAPGAPRPVSRTRAAGPAPPAGSGARAERGSGGDSLRQCRRLCPRQDLPARPGERRSGITIVTQIAAQLGLGELAGGGADGTEADFTAAAVVGLSDGDLISLHPPYRGRKAELYGEDSYSGGTVAPAVLRAAIEAGPEPGLLNEFQRLAADAYTAPGSPFGGLENWEESAVRIHPEAITIDGNPIALPRRPQRIADLGACLTGRSYIVDQAAFVRNGTPPFSYMAMTRTHFTNHVLISAYDTLLGPGTAALFVGKQFYIGREDGITSATGALISGQRAHGAPVELFDVTLVTGAQHTTREDLRRGMRNAHLTLKESGTLVIRSLARPAEAEIGTDEIVAWALNAGFEESSVIRYEAALEKPGVLIASGHFGDRAIQTAVLRK